MKPSHCENARAGTARLSRRLEGKFFSNLSSRFERKPFSVCRSPFHHGERSRHTECPSRSSPLLFWRSWSRQLRGKAANPSTAFLRCHSVSARSLSPRLCIGEGHSVLEVIFHGFFKEWRETRMGWLDCLSFLPRTFVMPNDSTCEVVVC